MKELGGSFCDNNGLYCRIGGVGVAPANEVSSVLGGV